jgi:hypothetical protein
MNESQWNGPRHESRDVDFTGIYGLAGLTIVLGVAILFGVWWLFQDLRERQAHLRPPANPLALEKRKRFPPPPKLEGIIRMEGQTGPAKPASLERPNTYGWVDRKAGVVRVPVDRVMSLIVDQKLIPSAKEPAFHDLGNPFATLPSPANSGRGTPKEQP